MKRYDWHTLGQSDQEQLLRRPALDNSSNLHQQVTDIVECVRTDGDAAVFQLTEKLDGVRLPTLSVSQKEFDQAKILLGEDDRDAICAAATNIERFHQAQLPDSLSIETMPGVRCERLTRPISEVGLYVPAGNAPLPSTALMLGIPARLAGCPTRVMCSPPQADGSIHPAVLYAAQICEISAVFKVGGAQAIAAMAYGTQSIPKVAKLFGPGNAWVTQAKTKVAQDPLGAAQDMPAGPSEILIIADQDANPAFVAADLLSQAEHGPDSQVILVTTSETLLESTLNEIEQQKKHLNRGEIIRESLMRSRAILVADLKTALKVSNKYAPEHLLLQISDPRKVLDQIQAAGSVFLGTWTPESVGDYCSGTNHVLPTYGFARSHSGLGVTDFLRSMTVQSLTVEGLRTIGPVAERLADLEGLDAHGRAVRERLNALDKISESNLA
ncbi:MAG: histidinol dehydrogenase [Pseudomonadota bacterium]|nr:histidinol dehydrogenase [Pseudomonadota bacterium]